MYKQNANQIAADVDPGQWAALQKVVAEPGGFAQLLNELLDDADPEGAADRKAERKARRVAKDYDPYTDHDPHKDCDPNDPDDPNRPPAMDRRPISAEDAASFAALYPNAGAG